MKWSNLGYADVNLNIACMQAVAGLGMLSLCVYYDLYDPNSAIQVDMKGLNKLTINLQSGFSQAELQNFSEQQI